MKIGIVTFWDTKDNYGQVLQGFALQQFLKKSGHEPFIIRYRYNGNRHYKTPLWKLIVKFLLVFPILKTKEKSKRRKFIENKCIKRNFDLFRTRYITFSSEEYNSIKELRANPPKSDCYIVGSDQVWGPLLDNEDSKAFFLDFGDENILRISYAASFGRKEYPNEYIDILKKYLLKLDNVSVREHDGVNICGKLGVNATHVLDPTFLLSESDYQKMITPVEYENYAYLYILNITDPNEIRWNEIKEYLEKNKLTSVITPSSGYVIGDEIFGDEVYDYATIERWLSNIYHSKFVVTTSFHGIVFSIILKKNFIYVPLKGKFEKGNNRALELLKNLGLENRVLTSDMSISSSLDRHTDWHIVDQKLQLLRKSSISFLENSILRLC
ncbi:MAG: polysaccharide pyruvyl transferase family protein [Dysgonamonadaceae bacterium]